MEKGNYTTKRWNEWVFIYRDDKCIIRMNDADFDSDEEMNSEIQYLLLLLNKNK